MLECTWNDSEADTALRRLLLKEQMQQKLLAANPQEEPETSRDRPGATGARNVSPEPQPTTTRSDWFASPEFTSRVYFPRLYFCQQGRFAFSLTRSTRPFGSACSLTTPVSTGACARISRSAVFAQASSPEGRTGVSHHDVLFPHALTHRPSRDRPRTRPPWPAPEKSRVRAAEYRPSRSGGAAQAPRQRLCIRRNRDPLPVRPRLSKARYRFFSSPSRIFPREK